MNRFVVSCVFAINVKGRGIHYSVALIFDAEKTPQNSVFEDVLGYWARLLAKAVELTLKENQPLANLKLIVQSAAEAISVAARCSVSDLPDLTFPWVDSVPLGKILTAHVECQMTTVIEVGKDLDEATRIAKLLSHFILPLQRQLSSLEVLPKPSPHLYLQIVEKQTEDPAELMQAFDRPVAWVRMSQKPARILKSADIEIQRKAWMRYRDGLLDKCFGAAVIHAPDQTFKYAPLPVESPCSWADVSLYLVENVQASMRKGRCEDALNNIVRAAVTLAGTLREKWKGRPLKLNDTVKHELLDSLHLSGDGDWRVVIALVKLFDGDSLSEITGGKKGGPGR
jgi:hypothetical protein